MKFVTDSSGFDSPRTSHTGSLKTPGAKRGEDEEGVGGWGGVKEERLQKKARVSGERKASVEWSGLPAAAAAAEAF